MIVRQVLILVALGSLAAASGCTERREHAEQRQQTQGGPVEATTPPQPAPSGTSTQGSPQAGDTARTVDGILALIHEEESKLSQIITAGRLHEVRASAVRIRDLLVAATRRADVPADQRPALVQQVSTVKDLAVALGEAGDAGDLDRTKTLNGMLQKELGVIERMIGRAGT